MPPNFEAKPQAPTAAFVPFTKNDYFAKDNVTFENGKSISPNDECVYDPVPTQ
jgi:hypothetical protein